MTFLGRPLLTSNRYFRTKGGREISNIHATGFKRANGSPSPNLRRVFLIVLMFVTYF